MLKLKLEKRATASPWIKFKSVVISVAIALLVGGLILLSLGFNPLYAYFEMFIMAFGSLIGIERIIIKTIPLLLLSVGLSVAFKAKNWNIGAPGQMAIGSIAATGVALFLFPNLPGVLLLPLMFIAGFAAGAGLATICAILKIKVNLNMVISTLLLNYVAFKFLEYLLYGPWQATGGYPYSKSLPSSAKLPRIGKTGIPYPTLLLAIILTVVMHLILSKSKLGYEIRAFGENREAAEYAGINEFKITILVMVISGGLAGVAGVGEVAGVHHILEKGITGAGAVYVSSYGYTAIFIAWLGRNSPLKVSLPSFFVAILLIGGQGLQLVGIPYAFVVAILGLMLLFLMAGSILINYRIVLEREKTEDTS